MGKAINFTHACSVWAGQVAFKDEAIFYFIGQRSPVLLKISLANENFEWDNQRESINPQQTPVQEVVASLKWEIEKGQ